MEEGRNEWMNEIHETKEMKEMNEGMNEWMNEWNEWNEMSVWMNEWTNEQRNELMNGRNDMKWN